MYFFSTLQSYRTATKPTPNHHASRWRLTIIWCSNNHKPSTPANQNPPTTNNLSDPNRDKNPKTNHHLHATVKTDEFLTDQPPQEPHHKPTPTNPNPQPPYSQTHHNPKPAHGTTTPKTQNPDHNT